LVWVAFDFLGLVCLLFEEKKGSGKVNLLLPLTINIFIGLGLGCFWLLGLGLLAD
jgi:hypothetical protein